MWKPNSIIAILFLTSSCVEPTSIVIEPLRVINWAPASGAYCVTPTARVSATFSDDLVASSVRADTFLLRDGQTPVEAALEYDAAAFTAHLTPAAPLAFAHTYTIVASADIEGKARGRLAVELKATFVVIARSGCIPPVDCSPPECCALPSDCPGTQICVNRTCVDECVADKDCFRGTCELGACVSEMAVDGGGGDPAPGDPAAGDSEAGDPATGDPVGGDPTVGDAVSGDGGDA